MSNELLTVTCKIADIYGSIKFVYIFKDDAKIANSFLTAACELADINIFNWYNLLFGNELC